MIPPVHGQAVPRSGPRSATAPPARTRWPPAALLLLFLGNAALYSLAVPIWEAPDEPEHFQYARYLLEHHALPTRLPSIQISGNQEANQPPLYYLLALPFAAGVDLGDAGRIRRNPHATWPHDPSGVAMAAHTQDEAWPYHGAVLAAHRLRLLSVLLGAATVALTWAVARECLPGRRAALLAAGAAALLPGFLFASATIDNDALADTLSAALLLAVLHAGSGRRQRAAFVFGVLAALALLTKLDTAVPVAVGIVTLLRRAGSGRRAGTLLRAGGPLLPALAFWAWRLGQGERNLVGKGVGWPPPLPGSLGPPDWSVPVRFCVDLWTSFFGAFGWQNVLLPPALYAFYGAALLAGLGGAVGASRRPGAQRLRETPLLCWWIVAVLASIIGRYALVVDNQGGYDHSRFLYPALPAIATIVAYGWAEGPARAWLRWISGPALAGGAVLAIAIPWAVIRPTYPAPFPVSTSVPPAAATVTGGRFDQSVTLAAAALPAGALGAGQGTFVTFYWRVQAPLPAGTWLFVHVEDGHGHTAAAFDGAPLYGALPVSSWRAGDVVADRELLTIHQDAPSGSYAVRVGWYQPKTGARIPLAAGGTELVAGSVRVTAAGGA